MKDMNGREINIRDVVAYSKIASGRASLGVGVVVKITELGVSVRPIKQRHGLPQKNKYVGLWIPENTLIIKREINVQSNNAQAVAGPVVDSGSVRSDPVVAS